MTTDSKKRRWFDLGATAFARTRPGQFDQPTYLCPICLRPFTSDALADKSLSVEHVPPKSFDGRQLLLTCTTCNNSSGTKLDADARTKEDVRIAMAGKERRPHRIRATIAGKRINGELHTSGGKYSLQIPPQINKPGTRQFLGNIAREAVPVTVQHEPFAELGAKISWFRSGYLALFAMLGYEFALDPAMEIVRRQILECDERRMVTFTSELPEDIPFSVRRVLRIIEPQWNRGFSSAGTSCSSLRKATCFFMIGWPPMGSRQVFDIRRMNMLAGLLNRRSGCHRSTRMPESLSLAKAVGRFPRIPRNREFSG